MCVHSYFASLIPERLHHIDRTWTISGTLLARASRVFQSWDKYENWWRPTDNSQKGWHDHIYILFYLIFECFLKIIYYFNRRIITLQYCGGFCHTLTWISRGCTCVPPPKTLPIPSLWVVPVYNFECPVSCIKLGLVIYFIYSNIHVLMLYWIIPPLPSPTESKSLLFISVSLMLSHI